MNSREFSSSPGGSTRATYLAQGWLLLLSAATALAVTVAFFDRTTLGGVSKLWLTSALICFSAAWAWWPRPHLQRGCLSFDVYEPASLVSYTFPLLAVSTGFAILVYA